MAQVKRLTFHTDAVATDAGATEDIAFCSHALVEVQTSGFSGSLDLQGRLGGGGTWKNLAYVQQGQDGLVTPTTVTLAFVQDTDTHFYRTVDFTQFMRVNMTRMAGTVSVRGIGSDAPVVPPYQASPDAADFTVADKCQLQILVHPFGKGPLTATGVQYGPITITSTDDYEVVETQTIKHIPGFVLEEIEFGLTMGTLSSGAAESVLYDWQIRSAGMEWQALCAEQTRAADASAAADVTVSGRFDKTGCVEGGDDFQVRCRVSSGAAAGETALGKAKNSSYIRAKYRAY